MMRSRPKAAATTVRTRRTQVGLVVGHCVACNVRFAAHLEHRADVRYLLTVHAQLCPGGRRSGEVVWPLGG